jgi:antitoxin PrlF
MSRKEQTAIPKAILEHLGLRPDDAVDFIVQDDGDVVLPPVHKDVRRLKGILHRAGRAPVTVRVMDRAVLEPRDG